MVKIISSALLCLLLGTAQTIKFRENVQLFHLNDGSSSFSPSQLIGAIIETVEPKS